MNAITKGIARDNDEDFFGAFKTLRDAEEDLRSRSEALERGGDRERSRFLKRIAFDISDKLSTPHAPAHRLGVTPDDLRDWSIGEVESFGLQCRQSLATLPPLVVAVKASLSALREAAGNIPEEGDIRDTLTGAVDDLTDIADDAIGDVIGALERSDEAVDEALELADAA